MASRTKELHEMTMAQLREQSGDALTTELEQLAQAITSAEDRVADLYEQRLRIMVAAADPDRGDDRVKVATIAAAAGVSDEAVTLQLRKGRQAKLT